jgi:hypothetical protein
MATFHAVVPVYQAPLHIMSRMEMVSCLFLPVVLESRVGVLLLPYDVCASSDQYVYCLIIISYNLYNNQSFIKISFVLYCILFAYHHQSTKVL